MTFSVNTFNIQCFTINNDGNKAIVAGKTQFELYSVDESRFVKKAWYKLKHLICLMDITWLPFDNLIVSCGSNGELYMLQATESELINPHPETSIKLHERTINRINYHPNNPNQLISGSNDGLIKLIDIRTNCIKAKLTFSSVSDDKITDCQFNPSPSKAYQFASGTEHGYVHIWDTRNPSQEVKRFNQHIGVVHLDYNRETYQLATAANDKHNKIYIYDCPDLEPNLKEEGKYIFSGDNNQEKLASVSKPSHAITHSESVTSVMWRPKRPTQVTACSSVLNAHLYVWDLNRPYVPYASFDQLTNKVRNFTWKANDPNVVFASTTDSLWRYDITEAIRPADYATLCTVQMDKHGSVAFSVAVDEQINKSKFSKFPELSSIVNNNNIANNSSNIPHASLYRESITLASDRSNFGEGNDNETNSTNESINNEPNNSNDHVENDHGSIYINNKEPINFQAGISEPLQQQLAVAGSYSSISLMNTNKIPLLPTSADTHSSNSDNNFENLRTSVLHFDDKIPETRSDWFLYAATNYKFKDKSFEELCDNNAQVALTYNKFNTYKDWMILKTIFKQESIQKYETQSSSYRAPTPPFNIQLEPVVTAPLNFTKPSIEIDTGTISNSSKVQQQLSSSQQGGLQIASMTSTHLLTINASTSSSSSSSSCPTSSSMNDNCSRIRHFSENDSNSNEANIVFRPSLVTSEISSGNQMGTNTETETLRGDNNNNVQFMSALHTDQHRDQLDIDEVYLTFHSQNKFDDEEDISTLPNDALEYNDDLSNECFINLKYLKTMGHNDGAKKMKNNLLKNEHQALNYLRNSSEDSNQHKLKINNDNNDGIMMPTTGSNFLLQPILQSNAINQKQGLSESSAKTRGSGVGDGSNIVDASKQHDDNFLKNLSTAVGQGQNDSLFSKMDFSGYFQQLLFNYVNVDNDLPTAIFMYQVTNVCGKAGQLKIDSKELDEWFTQYIELLAMFELWNLRIEVLKSYRSEFIMSFNNLTQKSILYEPMCATCKKTIKQNTFNCPSCAKNVFLCSYCHLPAKRLYAWCFQCCHGGHLRHMIKWFKNNTECPTGCGCSCRFN